MFKPTVSLPPVAIAASLFAVSSLSWGNTDTSVEEESSLFDLSSPYVFVNGGYATGKTNEEGESLWAIGAGLPVHRYWDVQIGANQVSDSVQDQNELAFFADVRGRLPLSHDHSLYGSLGYRIEGDGLQGGLGVLYHHDDNWTWDFGYRYFAQPSTYPQNAPLIQGDVYGFVIGLEYHFTSTSQPNIIPVVPANQELAPVHQEPQTQTFAGQEYRVVGYASGSAKINPQAHSMLDEVAERLTDYSQAHITVVGHADSVGSEQDNNALSQRRAESVSRYLREKSVDETQISVSWKGESEPEASNETANGRMRNRRTEITMAPFEYSLIDLVEESGDDN